MSSRGFPTTLAAFRRVFPDDDACAAYLERLRWPAGFVCPKCKTPGEPWHLGARAGAIRCPSCRADISLTAGTVMHRTHVPLATWFSGAFLITTTTETNATQLQEKLQLTRYETAFQMRRKLRSGMARPDTTPLDSEHLVEVDTAPLGHPQARGKRRALYVIAALELRAPEDHPDAPRIPEYMTRAGRLRLDVLKDIKAVTRDRFVRENVPVGCALWAEEDGHAPLVRTALSNLTSWLLATYGGTSLRRLHGLCNEYAFRFNRQLDPAAAFNVVLGLAPAKDNLWSTGRQRAPAACPPLAMPFT